MAEIVGSAVVGETVNRIISSITGKNENNDDKGENMERLEMARIKMEAALHTSDKWQITEVPLLHWRSKLKRAAQECDDTLRKCKQQALEEEEMRQRVRQSSLPKRMVHATKSFISSVIDFSNDKSSAAHVRRFERFADGAHEFLKSVKFGGTPRKYMFFNPLIGHLLSGKCMRYQAFQGSKFCYLGIRPMSFSERGVEAMIRFVCQDFKTPRKGFRFGFMLRLSESTDVFGAIIKCTQSFAPRIKFSAEGFMGDLIQLPTQDFPWVPPSPYGESQHWVNVHNTLAQWYRPNPLCCGQHECELIPASSSSSNTSTSLSGLMSGMFPEEVISMFLRCHVSPTNNQQSNNQSSSVVEHGVMDSDRHPLKLGVLVIPHDSPEVPESIAETCAYEVIGEQEMVHRNACLRDIDENFLPKALDYLRECPRNESRTYQMCLKSIHGTVHLCLEKPSARRSRASQTWGWDKWVVQRRDNYKIVEGWKELSIDLLKLWFVRSSEKLKDSIKSWNSP